VLRKRAKHGPIGLDIGASSVKLLQLADEGGRPALLAAAHCEVQGPSHDYDDHAEAIARAIREALGAHDFRGRDVVAALSSREFQLKSIRLPKMPAEELSSAVQFEAQDRFDFGPEAGQLRFIPAGEVRHGNEIKEEIIVFAARNEVLSSRLEMLKALKLRPLAIDIAPCAMTRGFARFLRRVEDADAVNVFLDVGWRGTSIVIARGTNVAFLKVVDVGGEHFTAAVSKALALPDHQATDLRISIMRETNVARGDAGAKVPEELRIRAADAVRPLVERISRDVQLCLRYFAVTFRGQRPDSLTFVGGEAHEPMLSKLIGEAIDIPCTIGHPLRGIAGIAKMPTVDRRTLQPCWAVAGGLALRSSPWVQATGAGPASPSRQVAGVA